MSASGAMITHRRAMIVGKVNDTKMNTRGEVREMRRATKQANKIDIAGILQ
jgi:hypothetical protein